MAKRGSYTPSNISMNKPLTFETRSMYSFDRGLGDRHAEMRTQQITFAPWGKAAMRET